MSKGIWRFIWVTAVATASVGCNATREFWRYVVEDEVEKPLAARDKGDVDTPRVLSPNNVKVVYNDGATSTEVLIPVLSSGQQIVIDHKRGQSPSALSVVPLPPSEADRGVEDAYVKEGHPVVDKTPAVSLVKTHERIRALVREGNYTVALEYAEQLLKRYPSHVKTWRTKGSLLLQMGERDAALKAYQKAQEIAPDPAVEEQIKSLEKAAAGG